MRILLTRPEPGATATAGRLTALGHEPILAPCLAIKPRAATLPDETAAIIVTSAQAIPALPARFQNLPIFCVGDATAGRLRQAGFSSVESAAGTADDLFRIITARRLPGTHLLASGERQGLALARRLRAAGIPVLRRTVYAARPIRALPEPARAALASGSIGAALFYSAETGRAFARLQPPDTGSIDAFALSPAVADALRGLPWRAIHVAVAPTEADLLALLP
jgi:uroporphyrinogen-III synthase